MDKQQTSETLLTITLYDVTVSSSWPFGEDDAQEQTAKLWISVPRLLMR